MSIRGKQKSAKMTNPVFAATNWLINVCSLPKNVGIPRDDYYVYTGMDVYICDIHSSKISILLEALFNRNTIGKQKLVLKISYLT